MRTPQLMRPPTQEAGDAAARSPSLVRCVRCPRTPDARSSAHAIERTHVNILSCANGTEPRLAELHKRACSRSGWLLLASVTAADSHKVEHRMAARAPLLGVATQCPAAQSEQHLQNCTSGLAVTSCEMCEQAPQPHRQPADSHMQEHTLAAKVPVSGSCSTRSRCELSNSLSQPMLTWRHAGPSTKAGLHLMGGRAPLSEDLQLAEGRPGRHDKAPA